MNKGLQKLAILSVGLASTIWFLIRVIPKPSRAAYPCMRAAAPFMSAFVLYLIGLFATVSFLRNKSVKPLLLRISPVIAFSVVAVFSFTTASVNRVAKLSGESFTANNPIGIARGIFPGRVVWIHDADATNENTTNSEGDYWFMDKNCDQNVVDSMLASGIQAIAGKETTEEAWDAIFRYFNDQHGKGDTGYAPGEKFAVKINLTNSCCTSIGWERMDAAPQIVLSILKQLIEVVHVPQEDIWLGDNYRLFRDEYWEKCHSVYPDVHYVDGTGANGREKTVPSAEQLLKFSDKQFTSSIPQHYIDADYLINIPCLKSHASAGITLAAKNHQGSILKPGDSTEAQSAYYMHYSLPDQNPGTGQYRCLVDYIGHKQLGGKTLIYIVDGLWAGRDWAGIVEKWEMAPFNHDYPSSLFVSQDALAIESVGFDFLLEEYKNKPESIKYPYMPGTDDYLFQAADPANWPAGLNYDPEGDGTILGSLGVFEHWNNATDKQYSRNLGMDRGIDLFIRNSTSTGPGLEVGDAHFSCYPNPFSDRLTVQGKAADQKEYLVKVYSVTGKLIHTAVFRNTFEWDETGMMSAGIQPGNYLILITDLTGHQVLFSKKVVFQPVQ